MFDRLSGWLRLRADDVAPLRLPRRRNEELHKLQKVEALDIETQTVVFVADLTRDYRETWSKGDKVWPQELSTLSPKASKFQTYALEYDAGEVTTLNDIISHERLTRHANMLLSRIKENGLVKPLFVAHGYGGVICEKAYVIDREENGSNGNIGGIILFDTAHFRAGLAQWSLLSAKRLGIPCAEFTRLQDWTELRDDMDRLVETQKAFRDMEPPPRTACYFADVPRSNLRISPEWAILPGVKSIPIKADHFEMTKFEAMDGPGIDSLVELLAGKLSHRMSQEAVVKYFMDLSKKYHGAGARDLRQNLATTSPTAHQCGSDTGLVRRASGPESKSQETHSSELEAKEKQSGIVESGSEPPPEPVNLPNDNAGELILVNDISDGASGTDIVFVHGLHGSRLGTWSKDGVCWPRDLLRDDLENVRVITWGYDASVTNAFQAASKESIFGRAETLLDDLARLRRGITRPILFVCHSLGGLVVKEALIKSDNYKNYKTHPTLGAISAHTTGVLFMGTPHRGSSKEAFGEVVLKISKVALLRSNEQLLRTLKPDTQILKDQGEKFTTISAHMSIICVQEGHKTGMGVIVPEASASYDGFNVRRGAINANHIDMVKFASKKDPGYEQTLGYIKALCNAQQASISAGQNLLTSKDDVSSTRT